MEKVVEEMGLHPDVTAGLSLGEYCAIEAAGGMELKDAVTTVRKRGILMEQAVPAGKGSMAAVMGMETEKIEEVLADIADVSIANYNCPGQLVIGGEKAAVEKAAAIAKEKAPNCIVMVDNCYGEFVQRDEPTSHGADLMAGSLIKNPGAALPPRAATSPGGATWWKAAPTG